MTAALLPLPQPPKRNQETIEWHTRSYPNGSKSDAQYRLRLPPQRPEASLPKALPRAGGDLFLRGYKEAKTQIPGQSCVQCRHLMLQDCCSQIKGWLIL